MADNYKLQHSSSIDDHFLQDSNRNIYQPIKVIINLNDNLSPFHTPESNDYPKSSQLSRLESPLQPKNRAPSTISSDSATAEHFEKIQRSHVMIRLSDIESSSTESSNGELLMNSVDNCTNPQEDYEGYNTSCEFVLEECGHKSELIDYLAFVLCDLPHLQVGCSHVPPPPINIL